MKNQWSGYNARTAAKSVAFLSSRAGLKWVIISYTRMLHSTDKIPFTERSTAVEQTSGNDEANCRKYFPGNKAAT